MATTEPMITTDFILTVAKWTAILFGVFVLLAGIFVKSDDTQYNDPNDYPPIF